MPEPYEVWPRVPESMPGNTPPPYAHRTPPDCAGALTRALLGILETRTAALFSLPPVLTPRSLRDVRAAITEAITVGAPAYNEGNVRGCDIGYWTALQTLLAAPPEGTILGYARVHARLRALGEAEPTAGPLDERGCDDFAWALRRCFDGILAVRGSSSMPDAVPAAPAAALVSAIAPTEADA